MRIQKTVKIMRIVEETPNIKTFRFDLEVKAIPGQFAMIWLPGVDEKPMSISYLNPFGLTILKRGETTTKLHELEEGDIVGIRGPLGRGFKLEGERLVMVGGGVGLTPLAPLAEIALKKGKEVHAIVGALTKKELLFVDRLEKAGAEVLTSTDDGTAGVRGFTTDVLRDLLKERSFDQCYTCGPEIMMAKVLELAKKYGIPTQVSTERYIKCGIGICGQCIFDDLGVRVCREGPVFRDKEIERMKEFGKYRRDASGKKIYFESRK